ncbi:carboxy terminal-processing peptidase [Desulfobulbus sp. US2]|nr:carboxy terminal-processing peptidase [Desulfobulbus sp. US2]WLE95638.1 MAG: carboxy terminal-processing peptidase [Candidatus Electrothrix communis]
MRMHRFVSSLLLAFLLTSSSVHGKVMPVEFDLGRNRLIAAMLRSQLSSQHFGHKPFDQKMSKEAYKLYLSQLDPKKQFLLTADVKNLDQFADKIDDEISNGRIALPDVGMKLLNKRVEKVAVLIREIMDAEFSPNKKDYLQTDPDKLTASVDRAELKDRWRRSLKMEVLDSYLDAVDKENKKRKKEGDSLLDAESKQINQEFWAEAMKKVRKKTDAYLERLLKVTRQEHYNRYFDAIARSFDPHTNYMAPTSKEDFDIHMSGSLEGIGALLREDDGHIKVVRVIPGSAAEAQGQLQAEDVIMSVSEKDGEIVDISSMSIREAVSYIRGPKGTEVRLTVTRADGARLVIPIVRDVVKLEETYVKSTVIKDEKGGKIGYVKIPSFYRDFSAGRLGRDGRNVTDDTRSELNKLKKKGINGIILDLRNNGGGSLSDAVNVSGLFLPGGPMVQVKNSQGVIRVLEDRDRGVVYDGPMIVLINQFAASASEIFAAAMQDYGRALVVGGAHTHGKGTVQALLDMNRNLPLLHLKKYDDLGALKVTIQKFYRVNGSSTQYKGVVPDVVLPSMLDYLETGEQYMDNSLPWDRVEAVSHPSWHGPHFDRERIQEQSRNYVAKSKRFKKIKEESLKAKKRKEETEVPVFLAGVIKERKELDQARKEAREAGVLADEEDEDDSGKEEKKTLDEKLVHDLYVDLAVFLMENSKPVELAVDTKK